MRSNDGGVSPSEHTPHRIQTLDQIFPVQRVGGVKAVDDHAAAGGRAGGVDVAALAKVKGDMAGEIEGIAPLFVRKGDLVHGPALHDPGIPVDEHAALHIGAADKAGTINAPARFAAPAVLGAQILFRLCADGIPERFLAAVVPRLQCLRHQLPGGNIPGLSQRVIKGQPLPLGEHGGHLKPHRLQRHVPDIAGAAIQQGHLGPAGVGQGFLGRFGQAAEQAAPLQLQHPHPLHLGQAEHIGGTAHQHQRLGQIVPQRILADKFQRIPPDKAVVAVKGNAKKILNIALAGHGGCGKTSVAESMIYLAKASERLGNIADGNTVLDYDSEEIKRQTSILTSVAPIEWKNTKINIIDTPGLFDFEGGVAEGMRAADSALIVVSGKDGVNVGTEKAVKAATKAGLTKIFFVNGLCDESARFYRVFESLKATFGPTVCPVVVPYIVDGQANTYVNLFDYKAYKYDTDGSVVQTPLPDMGDRLEGLREAIKEAVAETSEELLDKFIMGEEFTPEEIILGCAVDVQQHLTS